VKFITLVILPPDVSITSEPEINAAVDRLMAPFRNPWEQDNDVAAGTDPDWWHDAYHCYARGWIENSDAYDGLEAIVLHRTDGLSRASFQPGDGVASVVVAPDGRSVASRSTYAKGDPGWPDRAAGLTREFPCHDAVAVFCKS
jgi:hypothetical protein